MKVPAATLAILLVMVICSSAVIPPAATYCCFSYVSRIIPCGAISSVHVTSNICSLPGVILVTRKGNKLCADPKAPWVQAHLKHFQTLENPPFPAATPVQWAQPSAPDAQQSA